MLRADSEPHDQPPSRSERRTPGAERGRGGGGVCARAADRAKGLACLRLKAPPVHVKALCGDARGGGGVRLRAKCAAEAPGELVMT